MIPSVSATPVLHGKSRARRELDDPISVELVDAFAVDVELDEPCPCRVARELVAVLLRVEADDAGLQPQRQVLRDHDDAVGLVGQVLRHGEDAMVVVLADQRGGQAGCVHVVDLDAQRATERCDRHGSHERTELRPEVLEHAQAAACCPAEVGMITLGLELGDDDEGKHHFVLVEPEDRSRVREEHGRVEHVGAGHWALRAEEVGHEVGWRRGVVPALNPSRCREWGMGPDLHGAVWRRSAPPGARRTDCRAKRAELAEACGGRRGNLYGAVWRRSAPPGARRTDCRAQRAELAEACGGRRGN